MICNWFGEKILAFVRFFCGKTLVSEYRSIFLKQLRDMLDLGKTNNEHTVLQHLRIARDQADVKSLTTLLESNWINPFSSEQQDLVVSLACTPTLVVTQSVLLLGRAKLVHFKSSKSRDPLRKCLTSWEWNGNSLMIYFRSFRISLVVCTVPAQGTNSINELRYRLFCSKRGNIESDHLPPCADCLYKHAYRANYQTAIRRWSLENRPEIPSPLRHGWIQDENKLGIDWMSGQPAPEAVLKLLSCSCTRSCRLPNCSCLANGLKCTDMCRLPECDHRREEVPVAVEVDADDDDSDED